ncbi:MAG: undecaprenyl/decaprenyl-phosphate alpha-N-acetylglucosaminyl 1-phosphate transferase [Bacteroidia bacterium]|nr:undecaprenyl/decaprenyl-phosphate alpha-N-acetylglucosaminyl 1-phosphate transferase [Bacteroidia bacterium]
MWNEIFLRFARRLGALSQGIPNQRRWDSRKKPIIGGIAFFIICLGIAAWRPMDAQVSRALIAGSIIAFLAGLADDAYVSVPYVKLLGQLSAAGAGIIFGGPLLTLPQMPMLSVLFTLFWYVAVMNAINMMDNMDGIAGSIAAALLISTFGLLQSSPHYFLYAGMIGALSAFLLHNFYPSRLYMGDNGSQLLGYLLAYWGTEIWQAPTLNTLSPWTKTLILVTLFAILAGDTFWVSLVRLWSGRSPFHGGTDHLTHRLAQMGMPPRKVAFLLLTGQLLLSGVSLLLTNFEISDWVFILLISAIGVSIGTIHLHYLYQSKQKTDGNPLLVKSDLRT